ncbi:hypothetical protein GLX27_001527 [Malassezia furfur]|uniref:THO complex subunit 1 n=1 Tax=Malassezia furfur TaxID=55194 RepID=A0ABY8EMU8_MALFU|nr:hypothetical protein CBS14141_000813 [Malassezia furfur]WFD46883.1 hypothetical protein GLX27_001527 [Malassezia furfur]
MTDAPSAAVEAVSQALDTHLPQLQAVAHAHPDDAIACVAREAQPLSDIVQSARDALRAAKERDSGAASLYEEVLAQTVYTKVLAFALQGTVQEVAARLDVAFALQRLGITDTSLPAAALEEWMERSTTPACTELFAYMQSRAEPLTEGMVANAGKGLVVLRLCNELLRRLSKSYSPHAVLAGQILTFLSTHFPINERSGVNLKGEFHVENETPIEAVDAPDTESDDAPRSAEAHAADPHFYTLFWSLQSFFSNPARLFEEGEHVTVPGAEAAIAMHLCEATEAPMRIFQVVADCVLPVLQKYNRADAHPAKRARIDADAATFFPKYLSGKAMLDYELSDAQFRRHILTQFLILFQFLLGCSHTSRERTASWTNKLLIPPFTLSEADEKWTRRAWRHVQTQLRDTGNDGREYLSLLLPVLRRESSWIQWKAASAPTLEKTPGDRLDAQAVAEKEHAAFQARIAQYPYALGTPALSMLWEDGFQPTAPSEVQVHDEEGNTKMLATDGLEDLEMPPAPPSLVSLSRSMHMEEQRAKQRRSAVGDDAQDETLMRIQNTKQSLAWRALRSIDASQLRLLACMEGIDDIPGLLKAIQAEKQGEAFEAPVLHEADEEQDKAQRDAEAKEQERLEEEKRAQEEREARARAEEKRAEEKRAEEKRAEEKRAEEKRAEEKRAEENRAQEQAEVERAEKEQQQTEQAEMQVDSATDSPSAPPGETRAEHAEPAKDEGDADAGPPSQTASPGINGEHDTDDEAGYPSQMQVDVPDSSSVHTADEFDQRSADATPDVDADATFMTAPRAGPSSGESSRESTPVPLRSDD